MPLFLFSFFVSPSFLPASFIAETLNENESYDDDDVEILPIPENMPFDSRMPALADIRDDDVIVWQDISLIGDIDDADCEYEAEPDLHPERYSSLYALYQPLLPGCDLDHPTEQSTFYDAESVLAFSFRHRRRSFVGDYVISAVPEPRRTMTSSSSSFSLSKSPSIETLSVFELTDFDDCSEHQEVIKRGCDNPSPAVARADATESNLVVADNPSTSSSRDRARTENGEASSMTASGNCLECDRTLAWLNRLRINQYRHFEACVLIGLCVGLCLGLGTGTYIRSIFQSRY
jgi:hypothetical protein